MQQQTDLLTDVKSHFDHWRATRTKRGKIPEYLWDKIKPLIHKYSLTAITEALSINTNQMREHINLASEINFVEASTDEKTNSQATMKHQISVADDKITCSIELHRSTGGMLKIIDYPIKSLPVIISHFIG